MLKQQLGLHRDKRDINGSPRSGSGTGERSEYSTKYHHDGDKPLSPSPVVREFPPSPNDLYSNPQQNEEEPFEEYADSDEPEREDYDSASDSSEEPEHPTKK